MKKTLHISFHVYFWAMVVFFVATVIHIESVSLHFLLSLLDDLSNVIALIGIFGYLYKKDIFQKDFWRIYSPLYLVWNFVYGAYSVYDAYHETQAMEGMKGMENMHHASIGGLLLSYVLMLVILSPLFYGLFRYGKSKNNLTVSA